MTRMVTEKRTPKFDGAACAVVRIGGLIRLCK